MVKKEYSEQDRAEEVEETGEERGGGDCTKDDVKTALIWLQGVKFGQISVQPNPPRKPGRPRKAS